MIVALAVPVKFTAPYAFEPLNPPMTDAVRFTPFAKLNRPPAVPPYDVPFVTLSHAAFADTVTVCPLAIALSPITGTEAPGEPAGVVDHVAVSLKLPEATANLLAIF